uniref:non-specific serine/threonine protein kinase n=1 Tax=Aegilops tauschii subsp. strangulata TaxID=200361 RepID=A0A453NEF5_AEGTS
MEDRRTILMDRYEIGRQLGQGNFAKVYYGRNLAGGQAVAIKMIDKEKVSRVGLIVQIKREISIMGLVRHPNVLKLFEVMASKSKIYFVLEYAKGGELFNKITKGKLSEDAARKKISRAEYRCPRPFSVELRDLLYKILDPDPSTRASVSRIKRSAWYRKPVDVNGLKIKQETRDKVQKGEPTTSESTEGSNSEVNQEASSSLTNLNAFDIISLSTGFDLSNLFEEKYGRREDRFTTRQPAEAIFAKLNEVAKKLKLKIKKKENGVLKLAAPKEGM